MGLLTYSSIIFMMIIVKYIQQIYHVQHDFHLFITSLVYSSMKRLPEGKDQILRRRQFHISSIR